MLKIESAQNPKIKWLLQLHKRRKRDEYRTFLVEGRREIELAIQSGYEWDAFFFLPDCKFEPKIDTAKSYQLTSALMQKVSLRGLTEGCIATFHYKDAKPIAVKQKGLYLIIESVEKPGNLGAILRSADGAGVDGIFICDEKLDLYNPNLIRASLGARFTQALEVLSLQEIKTKLAGIPIFATSPEATKNIWQVDLQNGAAWLLGSEKDGLSQLAMDMADELVKIPMSGQVDSLNVSVASALVIYESRRRWL